LKYQWDLQQPDEDAVAALRRELGLTPFLARLLVNRGITEPGAAESFLNPSLDGLHDPFLMCDMRRAVDRIFRAIEQRERILIYGDYDVDGITSTVVLKRALEILGAESVDYHIPMRLEDGYGMKSEVVESAKDRGVSLVISADSGIRDFEVCRAAREIGVDLIVTDHHLPSGELPDAFAVLNPRRPDCGYPDKDLAAVGVILKVVQALFGEKGRQELVPHFLKVVAIGTVADMVPLVGENRIIVRHGLDGLTQPFNIGLQSLLEGAGVTAPVNQDDIGFRIAPRINAFTRMGGGKEIVNLFDIRKRGEADRFVEEMNRRNSERRRTEDRILAQIESEIERDPERFRRSFIVAHGEGWHRGVIGNVAARLAERFYRPTLVISTGGDRCQGSGRSIPGFHILEALESSAEFFQAYGGHAQAAGCTLAAEYNSAESVERLAESLERYAGRVLSDADLKPSLRLDADLQMEEISFRHCEDLELLAPYGIGNPEPVFCSRGVEVSSGPWVLKEKHLKFATRSASVPNNVIWWRNGDAAGDLAEGDRVDIAYILTRDDYQGVERLLFTVKDLHLGTAGG